MKKILSFLTVLAVMLVISTRGAWAGTDPYPANMTNGTYGPIGLVTPNGGTIESHTELFNAVNLLLGTHYTSNGAIDPLEYTGNDAKWLQTGHGGYTVIGLGAGDTNSLEVYKASTPGVLINPLTIGFSGNKFTGNGTFSHPYIGTGSVFPTGTVFGFDIHSKNPNTHIITDWRSDPALNSDGFDHMVTYKLSSLSGHTLYIHDPVTNTKKLIRLNEPFLLGFKDTVITNPVTGAPSDVDYNDLMVLVDGAVPVPEPITLALFSLGLLAMTGIALRRKFVFVK